MKTLDSMPAAGLVIIAVILLLFVLAVVLLLVISARYRQIIRSVAEGRENDSAVARYALERFREAYEKYGQDVNTPAIIADAVSTRLSGLLLIERFLNNSVSIFVTLGLFGTFLGLSLSVASLTELIGYSNTSEWLSVLDSVGGGLMSALSGMGVAFYTSLVGAGCSIVLTILRTIFSPQSQRQRLENRMELWLDQTVAPRLGTAGPKDEATLLSRLTDTLQAATKEMTQTLTRTTADMQALQLAQSREIDRFNKSVASFNEGIHDFTEVDYNLRGTVERFDLAIRDFLGALRTGRERGGNS